MKKGLKKLTSILICAVMLLTAFPLAGVKAFAAEGQLTNRAQWLSALVKTFNMTVENDENYPDNYFSDLTPDSEYYYDILLAVEFGLVNVEAGSPVEPEGEITREFAAQTLNFCLGFEPKRDEEATEEFVYSFSDYEDCLYPDDDEVAVNRGWFELDESGAFCPNETATEEQLNAMLDDAKAVLGQDNIKENYNSKYKFADYVVVMPESTAADIDENNTVSITDCPKKVNPGDTFVVFVNEMPAIYIAKTVTTNEGVTVITTDKADAEKAVLSVDMQEISDVDVSQFEPNENFEVDKPQTAKISGLSNENSISLSGKVELNGIEVGVKANLKDIRLTSKINTAEKEFFASVSGEASIELETEFKPLDNKKEIKLDVGQIRVAGVGVVKLELVAEISGKAKLAQKYDITCGIKYTQEDGLRNLSQFTKKDFSVVVEVSGKVGIKISAGIDILIFKADLYAEIGGKISYKISLYSDRAPYTCEAWEVYLYLNLGAEVEAGIGNFKLKLERKWEIYNSKNSPLRLVFHKEDGVDVEKCTRDGDKYISPADTKYGSVSDEYVFEESSKSSDFTYWIKDDGTAEIAGEGDFCSGYSGKAKNLNIPSVLDGHIVTSLGLNAFLGCKMTNVTIPDSVTSIGDSAFWICENLENVTIPDSVTSIGAYAFEECYSLTSITIPDSVTSIGDSAFAGCGSLSNIKIGNGVTSIGDGAFGHCGLISITIPDSVTSIGGGAFLGCESLTSIKIPDKVTSIGYETFRYCYSLTSITIGNSVTSIGAGAFEDCEGLTSITIPNSVTSIGDHAFVNCDGLTSVTIPDSVTSVGKQVFCYCDSLTEIKVDASNKNYSSQDGVLFNKNKTELICCPKVKTGAYKIPDGVTSIVEYAFAYCYSLTSVTIPESVISIGSWAFENCDGLTSVTIPDSVTSIGGHAFHDCQSLTEIKVDANNKNYSSQDGVLFNKNKTELIQYPIGNERTSYDIPNSVTSIGNYAFAGCESLTSVKIPDSVTSIEYCAFCACEKLTDVYILNKECDINDDYDNWTIPSYITIHGYAGSTAQEYANKYGNKFVALEEHPGMEKVPAKAATCTEDGNIEYYHCSDCNKNFKDINGNEEVNDIVVKATGHNPTKVTAKAHTDSDDGNVEYYECSVCHEKFADKDCLKPITNVTVKAGHIYEDGVCTLCGAKEPVNPSDPTNPDTPTNPDDPTNPNDPTNPDTPVPSGEVSGDNKLSTVDAKWILQNIAKSRDFSDEQFKAADLNGDGKLSVVDVKWVLQIVAGMRDAETLELITK